MKHLFYVYQYMVAVPALCFTEHFPKASDVTKLFMVLVNLSAPLAISPVVC